jgi:hypothetical protein
MKNSGAGTGEINSTMRRPLLPFLVLCFFQILCSANLLDPRTIPLWTAYCNFPGNECVCDEVYEHYQRAVEAATALRQDGRNGQQGALFMCIWASRLQLRFGRAVAAEFINIWRSLERWSLLEKLMDGNNFAEGIIAGINLEDAGGTAAAAEENLSRAASMCLLFLEAQWLYCITTGFFLPCIQ